MGKLDEIEKKQKEWEDTSLKKSLDKYPERETPSDLPKQRLYTPGDMVDADYLRDLGFPGEYPYTRGTHPTMYRSRIWGIAQYSGFGMPEDTNRRFKFLPQIKAKFVLHRVIKIRCQLVSDIRRFRSIQIPVIYCRSN